MSGKRMMSSPSRQYTVSIDERKYGLAGLMAGGGAAAATQGPQQ
jgi:hypothetical protein